MEFEVRRKHRNGVMVLELSGHLDFNNSGELENAIDTAYEDGSRRIVVDCSELMFIGSLGLATLLTATKKLREDDGDLVFCGVRGSIRRVFDIAGFSSVFTVKETQAEALGA